MRSTPTLFVSAALLFVSFLILSVSAQSQSVCVGSPDSFIYVGVNQTCDQVTTICKVFLNCMNGICLEPAEAGVNCTATDANPCGGTSLLACLNGTCQPTMRDSGSDCSYNETCLSNWCNNGTCSGLTGQGGACDMTNYDYSCDEGLFCLPGIANGTYTCQQPLTNTTDCTAALEAWELYGNQTGPVDICAPGFACMWTSATTAACGELFAGGINATCYPEDMLTQFSRQCQYNLTCVNSICSAYPSYNYTNISCSDAPFSSAPECPFGQQCDCASSTNTSATSYCKPYIGGDYCEPKLEALVSCVRKNNCSYYPWLFPSAATLFVGPAYEDWCVGDKCGDQHQAFLCCQNQNFTLKWGNDTKYDYTPSRTPTGQCILPKVWPTWVIPVIVLGGIVVLVTAIALVYLFVRRKSENEYEPINKS